MIELTARLKIALKQAEAAKIQAELTALQAG